MYELISKHGNAPPRRKSCDACKKGKRRCDLAFPACLRCVRRNIPCIYPGRQPLESSDNPLDVFFPEACSENISPTLNNNPDIINEFDLLSPFNVGPCPFDTAYFQSNLANTTFPLPLIEQPHNPLASHGLEVVTSKKMPSKSLSDAIASKLQFAIDILQEAPRMMVTEGRTPWCHRQLHKDGMPKVMQGRTINSTPNLELTPPQIAMPVALSTYQKTQSIHQSYYLYSNPAFMILNQHPF